MTLFGLKYEKDYFIQPSDNVSFFPGRQANLIVRGINCGVYSLLIKVFGIVSPQVLENFKIKNPVTLAEIYIQSIFEMILNQNIII